MQDLLGLIAGLNRPRLLVRAARFGVDDYNRGTHLPRLLGGGNLPRSGESIMRLIDLEADLNDRRVGATADYSIASHVAVLIALMGEARLLRAMTRSA
jgi:Family of unknown function (DUF6477)